MKFISDLSTSDRDYALFIFKDSLNLEDKIGLLNHMACDEELKGKCIKYISLVVSFNTGREHKNSRKITWKIFQMSKKKLFEFF